MKIEGKVWKFGDDVDTDLIIPARYLNTSDPKELALHCMEDADPAFASKVDKGDIMVAGKNFGCGSSREHAPIALKAVGVSCVIAKSFARIFYRNAFNIGLPILECDQAEEIEIGDFLSIHLGEGEVYNRNSGKTYRTGTVPPFMQELIKNGGLMKTIEKRIQQGGMS